MQADSSGGGATALIRPEAEADCARIVLSADPMAVRKGLQSLFDTLLLRALPPEQRGTAEIVLAEVLNNIVEHAYACTCGEITLTLQLQASEVVCLIEDHGLPMPGGVLPEGKLTWIAGQDDLPEGGFGWHLIRTLAHDLSYRRIQGCNQLRFRLDRDRLGDCDQG